MRNLMKVFGTPKKVRSLMERLFEAEESDQAIENIGELTAMIAREERSLAVGIIDEIKNSFLINSGRVKLIHLRPSKRDEIAPISETFTCTIPEYRMNVIQFSSFGNLKKLINVRILG